MIERLVCPRDRARLEPRGSRLECAHGHEFPYVEGVPVLVLDDAEPTQPLPRRYRALVRLSGALTRASRYVPLTQVADSVYVASQRGVDAAA